MYEKLYRCRVGRRAAELLARPGVSRAAGRFMDSRFSRVLIGPFRKINRISMDDFAEEDYSSFNAFFTRSLRPGARPMDADENALPSPCDGLLTVLPISETGVFTVKGTPYTARTLTENESVARAFRGGWCLIFRLTPANYHRYVFPDDGEIVFTQRIPGVFHTVRPEALEKIPVFKTNTREYACLRTRRFGSMLYMEVGAIMVGRIENRVKSGSFSRGEEKGYFEFGGSTVILFTAPGAFAPEAGLAEASARGEETPVRLGARVGHRP